MDIGRTQPNRVAECRPWTAGPGGTGAGRSTRSATAMLNAVVADPYHSRIALDVRERRALTYILDSRYEPVNRRIVMIADPAAEYLGELVEVIGGHLADAQHGRFEDASWHGQAGRPPGLGPPARHPGRPRRRGQRRAGRGRGGRPGSRAGGVRRGRDRGHGDRPAARRRRRSTAGSAFVETPVVVAGTARDQPAIHEQAAGRGEVRVHGAEEPVDLGLGQ